MSNSTNPFHSKTFTILWIATVCSNIGTWMHDVGAGWLMAGLTDSPIWVALIQTATSLPIFLLALPAGAFADIFNRRKILLVTQSFLALFALLLGYLVYINAVTPLTIIGITFLMGIGTAFTAPVWQAIVPSLVPKAALQQAVAVNSVGINISRAIGPAIAGLIITTLGIAYPFFLNALTFLVVITALFWWKPAPTMQRQLPKEDLLGAIRTGIRYAFHSQALKNTLFRAISFFLFASAYWAMLPLIAKEVLQGGASTYGTLLALVGVGAVVGAFTLPKLKKKLNTDQLVVFGSLGTALAMFIFALIPNLGLAYMASFIAGFSWLTVLTNLNVSAQVSLPEWVRARGLAIFVTFFFGSMSLGSLIWGQLASITSIQTSLLTASICLCLVLPISRFFNLAKGQELNLAPSSHWPAPLVIDEIRPDRGPVMIFIEYQISAQNRDKFIQLMDMFKHQRYRDGAYSWGIFQDSNNDSKFIEYFLVSSWVEHLRQHERVTFEDQKLQAEIQALHSGDTPPKVSHFIAP
ncbi:MULTISPECIES: MFS transporter [Acinetobacter]|uniref:MFS transporter n=1 Tax=Acinetobacter TaxID=469 RepID=UPI00031AABF4|nr:MULTISPECIES: MFS transporter [Acinetobacter]MQZ32492.1 MFS transporter [Acinetobacter haemolyticus]WHR58217.1 MFS transporter [Acinetobacter haemolyticus]